MIEKINAERIKIIAIKEPIHGVLAFVCLKS
jgi:hypothetical protein